MHSDEADIVTADEIQSPTVLDHFLESKNKAVNIDYFLFACLEEERLQNYRDNYSDTQYSDLKSIILAHKGQNLELTSTQVLDHGQVTEIVPGFIKMLNALTSFLKSKNDGKLPAKAKDNEDWNTIAKLIAETFPNYSDYMNQYINWRYTVTTKEKLDLSSIPPSGRFIKLHNRNSPGAFERKPPRKDGPRGRSDRKFDNRKSKPSSDRKFNDRKSKPSSDRKFNSDRNNKQNEIKKKREQAAMKEAKESAQLMLSNKELQEVILAPQNSFLRRKQHQIIEDLGLKSSSVGEGNDRSVKISNP